jgi:hypothetical protein
MNTSRAGRHVRLPAAQRQSGNLPRRKCVKLFLTRFVGQSSYWILTHIVMGQVPKLAFLWLGGIIMGLQKDILQLGRFSVMLIELHAAAWSGTIQSFIQEPVSEHSILNGAI